MKNILYWYDQKQWAFGEAALILYGLDPNKWEGMVPDQKCPRNQAAIIQYGLDNLQTMLQHLRSFLMAALGQENLWTKVEAKRICEWAYVTIWNFHFDEAVCQFLLNKKAELQEGYNWIDLDFQEMARKDLWGETEFVNALTYCPNQLGEWRDMYDRWGYYVDGGLPSNFHQMYPKSSFREDIKHLFSLSKRSDRFFIVEPSAFGEVSLYKPKELIVWAKEKNFQLPPKLLEYMGISDPTYVSDKTPTVRISQLHKQLCQAIAKTLWDIQPDMTIEEMKTHSAIQEYGGGKNYTGKNTLRDWLSEVDPRPAERKRGAPKKK